ncbi:putative aminoacrylate hydrolase RutD [Spatholobus suberectus]|nr:putative aminoacrylate hydrolase RutD [Spatholobus suberectus]
MPYCDVGTQPSSTVADAHLNNDIKIFYRTYGGGPTKVLLIIGLASTHDAWGPQIKGLTGTTVPNDDVVWSGEEGNSGIHVCAFDNRGVGQSTVRVEKSQYSTKIMAKDAIALLDHLGWKKAHVFGHSMGAMIACKVAAIVPDRVLSLALLNVTGGGFQCLPKLDRQTFFVAYRFLKAKTPEQRAAVDLDTHYSQEYLEEYVGTNKRRAILYQQYVKGLSTTGMQCNYGFNGQLNACWTHKMTETEIEEIKSAGFLVSVIHGRHDIIAQIYYAKGLAERLHPVARMVDLHGGHLVSHEQPEEVNQALFDLIKASEVKMSPHDWTNLPRKESWWKEKRVLIRTNIQAGGNVSLKCCLLEKLHLFLLYFFGVLVLAFEIGRKLLRSLKAVRVGSSPSYIENLLRRESLTPTRCRWDRSQQAEAHTCGNVDSVFSGGNGDFSQTARKHKRGSLICAV